MAPERPGPEAQLTEEQLRAVDHETTVSAGGLDVPDAQGSAATRAAGDFIGPRPVETRHTQLTVTGRNNFGWKLYTYTVRVGLIIVGTPRVERRQTTSWGWQFKGHADEQFGWLKEPKSYRVYSAGSFQVSQLDVTPWERHPWVELIVHGNSTYEHDSGQ